MIGRKIMHFKVAFLCVFAFYSSQSSASAFPDDDRECKRHNNEGVCRNIDGHYTCGCLFHEKPYLVSCWHVLYGYYWNYLQAPIAHKTTDKKFSKKSESLVKNSAIQLKSNKAIRLSTLTS